MNSKRSTTLRFRPLILATVMGLCVTVVTGMTMALLYKVAFDQQKERLVEIAKSRTALIQSVAEFNAIHHVGNHAEGALAATLGQVREAHRRFEGFGDTGEFTLATREGDNIVFLLSHRHADLDSPAPVGWQAKMAEPMRRALSGNSGVFVGMDYRGEKVLAAHEPLAVLGWGIVAKIDLSEIQRPFINAGAYALAAALILTLLGTLLFFHLTTPLVMRLEDSESKMRSVIESAVDSIIVIDTSGTVEIFNHAAEQMFGYRESEMIGKNISLLMPEPHRSRHDSYISDYLRTGQKKVIGSNREIPCRHKSGAIFPARLSVSEIRSFPDGTRHFTGIVHDISDKKRMEEELRKHAAVLEFANEAIIIMDPDFVIKQVNPAFCKLTGYSAEEMLGRTPVFLFPRKPDAPQLQSELTSLEKENSWQGKLWIRHKSGNVFPVWATSTAVKDDRHQVNQYIRLLTDIPEEEAAEKTQS